MAENNNNFKLLRKKAEDILAAGKSSYNDLEADNIKMLFHDLQVHQLELEMQNDELQQATIEMEEQRIKFSNLFELAPTGYFLTDQSGIIQNVNQAGAKLLGIEKYELLRKPLLLYIHKEDMDIFYLYFRRLLTSRQNQSCQLRLLNLQKEVLNVQVEGITMHSTASKDLLCYITITDFTGKQNAEVKLRDAKKRLEIALDASLTGIWEIDITTGKTYLDDFCLALFGFDQDNFNESFDILLKGIYPNDRKLVDLNIRQAIIEGKEFDIRFRARLPDNKIRYIQARGQVIKDGLEKARFLGTMTDINEKMLLEMEAVRVKNEQQQMILAAGLQAEENEKRRISEVLHNGIAQMLYASKLNVDQVRKSIDSPVLEQVLQLLNQSIRDIRNISFELAPSILTDFGLIATLEDMAVRLSNKQLAVYIKPSNISKTLDFQLQLNLFRIIQELVNNVIKHAFADKIWIEVSRSNKKIIVVVSDNGVGFSVQGNAEIPSGIGLSSIKNRLRLYKGSIKIEPNLPAGTKVLISLKH